MAGQSHWVALFSGGKDSSWALHRARRDGLPVTHALTARPSDGSYLFHVPAIRVTPLLAEAIGLELHTFDPGPAEGRDATAEGDRELAAMAEAMTRLAHELPGELQGVVSGAVASRFQHDRIKRLCSEMDVDHRAPLWECDPEPALRAMVDAGFDIRIVAVAAEGLDQSWLGRRIDEDALVDLCELHDRYGLHLMGEGGEYETIVVDGPHMSAALEYESEVHYDGTRGTLEISDAWLEGD